MLTRSGFLLGSLAAGVAGTAAREPRSAGITALDRYVALPTPEYRYDVVATFDGDGYRARVVSMTSQRWRSEHEVDKPLWTHWLTIVEPQRVRSRVGVLVISGGSNGDRPPRGVDPIVARLAVQTGAVLAELHMVPNQPLTFRDGRTPLGEDDLIAYTWDRFLHTLDDTWPLRLPMTKAAVRAMDTVTALTARTGVPDVDRFVVGGSSKRGWTTWTTAAVDPRVVAIVPVVIDVLNVQASAQHAYRAYGKWPAALEPYERMGIMRWLGTPQLAALLAIEDPYAYRERLTVPKLIVNATGDEYFAPDSSQFYFDALPGERHLRYLPNTDHALRGAAIDAAQTGLAFLESVIAGTPRPRFSWRFEADGTIRVRSARRPAAVKLWQAVNPHARDFRLRTIGPAFHATELGDLGDLTYAAAVAAPASGFRAAFVELTYAGVGDEPFTATTSVRVIPDVLPFAPPSPMASG